MSQKKKQTFLEYYMMMEVPMGFSFGGPTIDKGIDKGVEAASKGIQKIMRRIDLNTMATWEEVSEDVYDDLMTQLRSDAQGEKVLVKDVYKVQTQGMRDSWVKYFPTMLRLNKSATTAKDSKNREDQAGEPVEITAFIAQPPNRMLKKTQASVGIGASMGGKIVFVTTVDENQAEHYYIGAEKKATDSIIGIAKISLKTAILNKTFGKILSGTGKKSKGWMMYSSIEINEKEYNKSMGILNSQLKSKFKPDGIASDKLEYITYSEANGPYSGGDSGWLIKSHDPNFPNTELAILGKKSVSEDGDPKFNINVYGRGIFSQQKYVDVVYSLIQTKIDKTKVGKAEISNPFGKINDSEANMTGAEDNANPNTIYTWEYEEGDVDGDFTKLASTKDSQSLKDVVNELNNKDLATIIKALTSTLKESIQYVVTVTDNKIVNIKTKKGNQVMAFGKQEDNDKVPAKCVITNYGHELMTQPENPEIGNLKQLTFKKGTL